MANIRCDSFDGFLWRYVTETAKLRKISRCDALKKIVEEHMRLMAKEQRRLEEKKGAKKKERR